MPVNGGREIIAFEVGELQPVGNFELCDRFEHSSRTAKDVSVHMVRVRHVRSQTDIGTCIRESFRGTARIFVTVNQEMASSEIIRPYCQDSFIERDSANHATLTISERIRLFGTTTQQQELLVRWEFRERVVQ